MPRWSILILVIAVILAILAFGGLVAAAIAAVLKILFAVAIILFLASLFTGRRRVM